MNQLKIFFTDKQLKVIKKTESKILRRENEKTKLKIRTVDKSKTL